MPFLPNTEMDVKQMLDAIGVASIADLFKDIPAGARLDRPLDMPEPMSEKEIYEYALELACLNDNPGEVISFLGAGSYHHYSPAAVDELAHRAEFYTAYTPYQPETSQGVLQAFFEYQSFICELTGMDVSNASMYDGGSALAEAVLLAHGASRKLRKVLVPKNVHPEYRRVVRTYLAKRPVEYVEIPYDDAGRVDAEAWKDMLDGAFAVVVQSPNFFGVVEDVAALAQEAHDAGALVIGVCDPVTLMLVTPPGEYGADIAVGDAQACGIPPCFGGPHLGFFAVREKLVRKMPGRIVGMTRDIEGRRGFVLTLQPREQHIRREKATSNICTNHALNALRAAIYLALMGKSGMELAAQHGIQKAHYLADSVSKKLDSYGMRFTGPFCREFVIRCPGDADTVARELAPEGIFAGVPLNRFYPDEKNGLLVACTEMNTKSDCDALIEALASVK